MVDFMWVLIRCQTKVQLGYSACRDYRLDARSLITAADATDGQARADRRPRIKAIATLALRLCCTRILQYLRVGRPGLSHVDPLPSIPLSDAIIEARYVHSPTGIVQLCDDLAQHQQRVPNGSAEHA